MRHRAVAATGASRLGAWPSVTGLENCMPVINQEL